MSRDTYLPFGRPNFSQNEIAAVASVLESGWIGMGPQALAFEQELAAALRVPHVVTVNSCTSALFLSLKIAGVGPGDEVICPSLTWCSTANAILYTGATPVFCDVDDSTLCATSRSIMPLVGPKTRAVIIVHFGGLAADVRQLRRDLPSSVAIVEDAAHAFGARFAEGTPVGASGNSTCFSFYANKNLSTGDGGAIALFDRLQADHVRRLRQHAMPLDAWKRFSHSESLLLSAQLTELGYKMNYTDLQAAIGRVQLARQTEFGTTRLAVANCYVEGLRDVRPRVTFQAHCTDPAHARHLFVVKLPVEELAVTRDELVRALRLRNIGAAIHYAPLHTMPLYSGGRSHPSLPVTEALARSVVTLPISASMTLSDAADVVRELRAVLASAPAAAAAGSDHAS